MLKTKIAIGCVILQGLISFSSKAEAPRDLAPPDTLVRSVLPAIKRLHYPAGEIAISCLPPVSYSVAHALYSSKSSSHFKLTNSLVQYVKDYIRKNEESLLLIRKRSIGRFPVIDSLLSSYGIPVELKYLAVIESELKTHAVSGVGAAGPWQLMPQTARLLGLQVNGQKDERLHYSKSTKAAASYLKKLYDQFGDWLLVVAAYNSGPGTIYKAIRQSGSRNFWALQHLLPAETRGHVKRFIATHYFFEGSDNLTTVRKMESMDYLKHHYPPAPKSALTEVASNPGTPLTDLPPLTSL